MDGPVLVPFGWQFCCLSFLLKEPAVFYLPSRFACPSGLLSLGFPQLFSFCLLGEPGFSQVPPSHRTTITSLTPIDSLVLLGASWSFPDKIPLRRPTPLLPLTISCPTFLGSLGPRFVNLSMSDRMIYCPILLSPPPCASRTFFSRRSYTWPPPVLFLVLPAGSIPECWSCATPPLFPTISFFLAALFMLGPPQNSTFFWSFRVFRGSDCVSLVPSGSVFFFLTNPPYLPVLVLCILMSDDLSLRDQPPFRVNPSTPCF